MLENPSLEKLGAKEELGMLFFFFFFLQNIRFFRSETTPRGWDFLGCQETGDSGEEPS